MPFNGSGSFTVKHNWTSEAAAGMPISAPEFDDQDGDMANALSNCITRDGQGIPAANISWNGYQINNLGTPLAAGDAVNKSYVDTPTLNRNMAGFLINNLGTPLASTDAATKGYVDTATQDRNFNGYSATNINRATAQYVTLVQQPVLGTDAAPKSYVDNANGSLGSFVYAMAALQWLNQ